MLGIAPIVMAIARAQLVTKRLVLRPLKRPDAPELLRIAAANRVYLAPWSPTQSALSRMSTLQDAWQMIARQQQDWKNDSAYCFGVFDAAHARKLLGFVVLTGVMRGAFQSAHLGYWIEEQSQGDGLISESVHAVLNFAFERAKLHRVQAAIMPRNARSLGVIRKMRFREEGCARNYLHIHGKWEDHLIFAKTSDEHGGVATEVRV